MTTLVSARLRALAGVTLLAALGALAPASTSADTQAAPAPSPAQRTLIELHEYVGAGWWSAAAATSPSAQIIPASWVAPLAPESIVRPQRGPDAA